VELVASILNMVEAASSFENSVNKLPVNKVSCTSKL